MLHRAVPSPAPAAPCAPPAPAAPCGQRVGCQHARCAATPRSSQGPQQASQPPKQHEHASHQPGLAAAVLAATGLAARVAEASAATAALGPVDPVGYVPSPLEVPPWQIWFASGVAMVPFVIGAYEFGKRILIQRRCKVCAGSGLVSKGRYQRKCPECGGFFPWVSWRQFLSANTRPGNGGPLLQPRGQTSVFYSVPPAPGQKQQQQQQRGGGNSGHSGSGFAIPGAQQQQQQQQQEAEQAAPPASEPVGMPAGAENSSTPSEQQR